MTAFCAHCGFPLAASSAFCPKCGAKLPQPTPPPPAAPVFPSTPAAAKSGSGLKIVLVICGVLLALGVVAVAGVVYVTHRVKEAVVDTARAHGVDLDRVAGQIKADSSPSSAPAIRLRKPCEYLSKDEVSSLIGEPIDRAVAEEESCQYFGPPGLAARLGKQGISTGMNQLQKEKPGNAQMAEALNNLINGMGAQGGEERPLLIVAIDPDGKAQMTAIDVAGGLFGQIPGGKPEEISGLGDRAVRFANLGLNVMKGRAIVRIVAGPIPDPDPKTIAVAKAVLSRL